MLTTQAKQLLNWARKASLLNEEEFTKEYNEFSATARKQIASFPLINAMPTDCTFPWMPNTTRNLPTYTALPPITPPLTEALPGIPVPSRPIASPSPQAISPVVAVNHPVVNPDNNRQQTRRRRYSNSDISEDSYHPPTTRQRTISNNNPPPAAQLPAENHSKVKQLLKRYAPKLKWQRFSDQRPTLQPVYETYLYNYFTTQSATEELIFKFYVDIKDSLTLAYQSESQASYHHYNVGMKLCLLQERLSGDTIRFERALTDIGMEKRTFRRYRNYYQLLRDYSRFRHCTISFTTVRDISVAIRNWFNSDECIALPVTDTTSASFWRNEPTSFHNFDTITVINDNPDTEDSDSEQDFSSDQDSDTNEDLQDDEFYNGGRPSRHLPISKIQFQTSTEWQFYNQNIHQGQDCSICYNPYQAGQKITSLPCRHHYHTHCVESWLTERSDECPYCRSVVG